MYFYKKVTDDKTVYVTSSQYKLYDDGLIEITEDEYLEDYELPKKQEEVFWATLASAISEGVNEV